MWPRSIFFIFFIITFFSLPSLAQKTSTSLCTAKCDPDSCPDVSSCVKIKSDQCNCCQICVRQVGETCNEPALACETHLTCQQDNDLDKPAVCKGI
uniref:IGFBP N-terminal domain-containing protein n=1 Tax=Caenorhabditis japonica TaxID=281687 RepID=A0A8R1EQN3_CAEJA